MSASLLLRSALPRTAATRSLTQVRYAATANSSKYVPGGPVYKGTVNDPTTFPAPSRLHGTYHWQAERLLSAALIPITAGAFVSSVSNNPVFDAVLGLSLIMHSHIGFDALLVDYVHERKFPTLGKVLPWVLRGTTVAVVAGVYQFNTTDVGLTELITKVWTA